MAPVGCSLDDGGLVEKSDREQSPPAARPGLLGFGVVG
jgi:hypothetical protein